MVVSNDVKCFSFESKFGQPCDFCVSRVLNMSQRHPFFFLLPFHSIFLFFINQVRAILQKIWKEYLEFLPTLYPAPRVPDILEINEYGSFISSMYTLKFLLVFTQCSFVRFPQEYYGTSSFHISLVIVVSWASVW